ncbi:MAG: TraR/DksA C4-type zinc finger protein [Phycisphaerales bacterium]|nr:TraR/DksA C4-type zinc finger protein [Phycisphaerales bacterium]
MTKKKTVSKKSSVRKVGKKSASKGAGPAKKKAGTKTSAKKATTKKAASKKAASKKTSTKKSSAKKPAQKKPVKAATKKTSKKVETKAAPPAAAKQGQAAQKDDPKNRKGITVVQQKRSRPSRPKQTTNYGAASAGRLSGLPRKPMIPSGPDAPAQVKQGASEADDGPRKSPFNKRQLAKYRKVLLEKRAILVGELNDLEEGALRGSSGSLSHLPQHMAEQGSEMADQSLSLNLAATERSLIKEIDEALQRIENKTFGICELTGRPIRPERLEELPWTRYSIDAARELERRSMPR